MNASIDQAAIGLAAATLLGASIGFERQWRQRMAGLRTNTLVAIGAASFVIFAGLFPDEGSPTRVAAQVVSGIGFLGAGIIFREGLHVTGLNTAATLCARLRWACSQAPGIRCMRRWQPVLSFSSTCCCDHWFGSSTGNRLHRPKPTFTTASGWSAETRKRRMSGLCSCRARATDNSACGGLTVPTSMTAGVSKSSRSCRLIRRATLCSSKSLVGSASNQPFRPRAGASNQSLSKQS